MVASDILYPISLSSVKSIQNIFTKSYLLPFVKNITNNSVLLFFIYKHVLKTLVYLAIFVGLISFKKESLHTLKTAFTKTFSNSSILINNKSKKGWFYIGIIILYIILEITNGITYYNSLMYNNLNKFVIYMIVFSILFNGLLSYYLYNEKFTPKLVLGYLFCIIGIVIVKLA